MKTTDEIKSEVAALKSLVPTGRFRLKTAESIALQVEELESGFDDTSGEWDDLTSEQQECIMDARAWKEGAKNNRAPSTEWTGLVA